MVVRSYLPHGHKERLMIEVIKGQCCVSCCTFSPKSKTDIGKHCFLVRTDYHGVLCPKCRYVYREW